MDLQLKSGQLSRDEYSYFMKTAPLTSKLKVSKNGTGFFINSDGMIATNHHVVVGCDEIVVISKIDFVRAKFVSESDEVDIALIKTNLPPPGTVIIRNDSVRLGERVFSFGYPFIKELRALNMSEGIISAVPVLGIQGMFQMTAALQPGSSGGPVVDANGALIGISVARLDKGENVNFAIESSKLLELLRLNKITVTEQNRNRHAVDPEKIAAAFRNNTIPIFCLD